MAWQSCSKSSIRVFGFWRRPPIIAHWLANLCNRSVKQSSFEHGDPKSTACRKIADWSYWFPKILRARSPICSCSLKPELYSLKWVWLNGLTSKQTVPKNESSTKCSTSDPKRLHSSATFSIFAKCSPSITPLRSYWHAIWGWICEYWPRIWPFKKSSHFYLRPLAK